MKKNVKIFIFICCTLITVGLFTTLAFAKAEHKHDSGNSIMTAYLKIGETLANDSLKDVADYAEEITSHARNKNEGLDQIMAKIAEHSEQMAHGTIESVRNHFTHLSQSVINYKEKLSGDFEKNEDLFTFYCPMEKKYWMQDTKIVSNPFLGKKMPGCGNIVEASDVRDIGKTREHHESKHSHNHNH